MISHMAEANPNLLPNNGGDPPNKKNTTTATAVGGSKEVKIEDTGNSKPKKGNVEEVNIYNVLCIRLNIGNARGWIRKMRELKIKFNTDSALTDDVDKKEFELWKKIWGDEPKGDDHDPDFGSSM
ncbi:unnamed protein product [Lactuca saligna]|uniref:Uncharacterized protein n=1 Tax=Lactuca saligna TaxID=75948 RepID=A0AA35Y9E7_LACSI|nr:unnamed protein product [Lactuca saligna]